MRFKTISFENIFSYSGVKTFNFDNSELPITLIIGENGCGKTSFINSVKIALHGITKDLLNVGTQSLSKSDYILGSTSKHFSGLLNRDAKQKGENQATIIIEIDDDDSFKIERQFTISSDSFSESLILKDENDVVFSEGEDAQDIINSKISPNMSNFFFFDGEKIQTIADFSHSEFTKFLEDVLELDLYDFMVKDADTLIKKLQKNELDSTLLNQVVQIEKELENTVQNIVKTKEQLKHEQNSVLRELKQEHTALLKRLKKLKDKHELEIQIAIERKSQLEEESKFLNASFKKLTLIQLPLLLNTTLKENVEKDIELNYRGKLQIEAKVLLEKKQQMLDLLGKNREEVGAAFDQIFQAVEEDKSVAFADPFKIEKQFDTFSNVNISNLLSKLSKNKFEKAHLEQKLVNLYKLQEADQRSHAEEISKEKDLLTKIGRQEAICESLESRLQSLLEQEKSLKSDYSKLTINEYKSKLLETKIQTLQSVINVSRKMKQKIKSDKRATLEIAINQKFQKLKKEGYEADKIVLDDEFKINVFDINGRAMDILSSSSGQKQIIATALIWGISEYISEDIPMIIDTPLGRLDEKNQSLILSEFYPHASKQVIILPTPSEMRHEGFDHLQQYVSEQIVLDNKGSSTTVIQQSSNKTKYSQQEYA